MDPKHKDKYLEYFSKLTPPTSDGWKIGRASDGGFTTVSISRLIPDTHLLNHILHTILGFPCDWMPMEKVAWETGFMCDGVLCKAVSRKFGYKLLINSSDPAVVAAVQEYFVGQSNKAIKYFKGHLQEYAQTEIQKGDVTIDNRYAHLKKMFEYFSNKARAVEAEEVPADKGDDMFSGWNRGMEKQHEIHYLNQAAYFAFFGLLEHVLILLLAFTDFDPKTESLKEIISKPWSDKYKRIFDLRADPEAYKYYQAIQAISKVHRNPHAHGLIGKDDGRSMNFVLEGTGLISAYFPEKPSGPFPDWMISGASDSASLGKFLDWLEKGSSQKVAMQIVTGGLDVHFSDKYRKEYKTLVKEGDATDYVEGQIQLIDNYANMDW